MPDSQTRFLCSFTGAMLARDDGEKRLYRVMGVSDGEVTLQRDGNVGKGPVLTCSRGEYVEVMEETADGPRIFNVYPCVRRTPMEGKPRRRRRAVEDLHND